jgi:hypothetical protein
MKDEEMAEEYENAQDYCGLLDVLFEEQYNQDYGGLSCYISPYIEQAYLAGLKAGRPKWHKVADGDLPKTGVQVLSEKGTLVIYKGEGFNWVEYSPNADNIKLRKWEEPIAWEEIVLPKEDK